MTIHPSLGQNAAEVAAEFYRDAELRILRIISRNLQVGIEDVDWELAQLARLQTVRAQVLAVLTRTNPQAAKSIRASLDAAYGVGRNSVLADVRGLVPGILGPAPAAVAAVEALAADVATGIALDATNAILRRVEDVYREVVTTAAAEVLTGTSTRRDAAQRAVTSLLSQGINGIETGAGRMSLPTYVTMAVRTATARSALVGVTTQMASMGLDLVMIHPGARPCDICDAWAMRILAVTGEAGTVEVPDVVNGGTIEVEVEATLDDARADGWGHPNDRCNLEVYLPGATDVPSERPPWDAEGYAAQQDQRYNERQIRDWKQQEAIALTPDREAQAAAKVSEWQQTQRDHLAANPDLKRQYEREQVGAL